MGSMMFRMAEIILKRGKIIGERGKRILNIEEILKNG